MTFNCACSSALCLSCSCLLVCLEFGLRTCLVGFLDSDLCLSVGLGRVCCMSTPVSVHLASIACLSVCLSVGMLSVWCVLVWLKSVCLTDWLTEKLCLSFSPSRVCCTSGCRSVCPPIVCGISFRLSVCLSVGLPRVCSLNVLVFLLFSQHTLHPALSAIEVIFFKYSRICSGFKSNINLWAYRKYTVLLLIHSRHS